MPPAGRGPAHLRVELDQTAVTAGDVLVGMVELATTAPCRVESLRVVAAGREVVRAVGRWAPAVYRYPVPRPFGRTRSGAATEDYRRVVELPTDDTPLEAGRHLWRFALALPSDALPTYSGATVVVEHDLLVEARVVPGGLLRAWVPLHLWRSDAVPEVDDPVKLVAPAPPLTLAERVARRGRAPVRLEVELPAATLSLCEPLLLAWHLENPHGLALGRLALQLVGVETSRHLAATDVHSFVAAAREVTLEPGDDLRGEVVWPLPSNLAPSLSGRRFTLEWRLDVSVTLPWMLGISASAPLHLVDRLLHPAAAACGGGDGPDQ